MAIPDYREHVEAVAARHPDAWRAAHRGGADTERFIRLVASYLHYNIDPRVGLNGKRGSLTDVSDDGLALLDPEGLITNTGPDHHGERFWFIDIIGGAGGDHPTVQWANLSGTTPSTGVWIQPERIHDSVPAPPEPEPEPPPQIPAVDYSAQLQQIMSSLVFVINQLNAVRNDTLIQHQQLATVIQKQEMFGAALGSLSLDVRRGRSVQLGHRWLGDVNGVIEPIEDTP